MAYAGGGERREVAACGAELARRADPGLELLPRHRLGGGRSAALHRPDNDASPESHSSTSAKTFRSLSIAWREMRERR